MWKIALQLILYKRFIHAMMMMMMLRMKVFSSVRIENGKAWETDRGNVVSIANVNMILFVYIFRRIHNEIEWGRERAQDQAKCY